MEKTLLKRVIRASGVNHSVIHGVYAGHPFQASIYQSAQGYQIQINGHLYQVNTSSDRGSQDLNMQESELQAPMEGLIVNVLVTDGEIVNKGQTLLQLESMKLMMEIKAPCESEIEKTLVKAGQKVEATQLLFKLKPLKN